ncbi:MAG TPA: hypothetical protein VGG42_02310 [Acidobacteriaceae bacterium]|jgi:hypothetical protein
MKAADPTAPRADGLGTDSSSLVALLREAIEALVRSDAQRLERILCSIDCVSAPVGAELAEARSLRRLLGALLKETHRNLRLLRRSRAAQRREWYGSLTSQFRA